MSHSWLCPLRPPPPHHEGGAAGIGWDNIEDADVMRDPEAQVIGHAGDIEEASAMDESSTQIPVGKPEPAQPTKAEKTRHDLTHITYRNWCPHCLMRRPSAQHRSQSSANPILCGLCICPQGPG